MYKVKVDMVGFEKFTGLLAMVPFTDGVSDREITPEEAGRLGAIMKIVKVDGDEQVGASVDMANSRYLQEKPAPVKEAKPEPKEEPKVELEYDRDRLEEIASEGGIKAIREIANKFDVKGVQINSMIDDIIEAQTEKEE